MTDDETLTPAEAERLRWMIRTAAQLARVGPADELAILERLAAGDRAGAERAWHKAIVCSMCRELDQLLDAGGVPTRQ